MATKKPASLAAVMGPTNSLNGVPIQPVVAPTYANPVPANGNYQQFLQSLEQAQNQANKQNQTNFGQAIGLETQGLENQQQSIQQAIQAQAGYGQAEQTQLQQNLQSGLGANLNNMVSRGLNNTTIAQTSQAPIEQQYNQGVAGISNQAANLQAGLYSNLASSESNGANSIANLLAQENNTGPNQALLSQLQQRASSGAVPTSVTNFSGAQPPVPGQQFQAGNSGVTPPKIPGQGQPAMPQTMAPAPTVTPSTTPPPPMPWENPQMYPVNNLPGSNGQAAPGATLYGGDGFELPNTSDNSGTNGAQAGLNDLPPTTASLAEQNYQNNNPSQPFNMSSMMPQVGPGGGSAPDASLSGGATPAQAPPPGQGQTTPPAQAVQPPVPPTTPPAPINIAPQPAPPAAQQPPSISSAMQPTGGGAAVPSYWQGILNQIGFGSQGQA